MEQVEGSRDAVGSMINFRKNSVSRICPACHRVFWVAPTPTGYNQRCLFCDKPLEDPNNAKRF